ncbi:D-alanyl-D-alanine carboxypeptidase [uncultured Caudovirales phage]|uniref:D-alanyl-D-alanine carboxypeptidase n=1 Tax=uncultured Caudovirales phage TaxID=2100421 RepID=A0A6J5LI68_9CAUD|nr:D-alanyl-D-alanine carboxypeptidase [uncultured Caudovirales phage]CAB4242042.1 D-alanyl-D-alanine carboxypeptidase [uncultured Caudovirales phage]
MINSRSIDDLHPRVKALAERFLDDCHAAGLDVLIYSTYRDIEAQNAIYAQGRTTKGSIVTNAKGGQSFHNYRLAFDWVPIVHGKPLWSDAIAYAKCAKIGEALGLEWAGRWAGKFKETAHFQYSGGLSLADLQAGKTLK